MRPLLLLSLALALSAISSAQAQDVAAGEKLFLQCRACHQVGDTARNAVGPVLNGLFGRKAGMVEGFTYSPANKNSGRTLASLGTRPRSGNISKTRRPRSPAPRWFIRASKMRRKLTI